MTMPAERADWQVADPFDLPEWLGEHDLTWTADSSIGGPSASGALRGRDGSCLPLAVLGADEAFPVPTVAEAVRTQVHQAWRYGQVALLAAGSSYAVAVPAITVDVGLVCEALRRFAKAIGIDPDRIRVLVKL
jgi:hypothetical protein